MKNLSVKRKKKLRGPKGFKATHPGHLVALDTIEKNLYGIRRYVITFEDIHTRFSFAWAISSYYVSLPYLPKTPMMNAHVERFNSTVQSEFIDYYLDDLHEVNVFNCKLIDYLIWYKTRRMHWTFINKQSPAQYILSLFADDFFVAKAQKWVGLYRKFIG